MRAHAAVVDQLESELEAEGLVPLSWYDVLYALSEAPASRLRMQDLARAVLLSKSGITRLVDRMERVGLVRREPFAEDRRGMLTVMTASGRAALRRATPVHLRGVQQHFAGLLSDTEARTLIRTLERISDEVEHGGARRTA
jgi:DNA-binding MarR family transcriptional regulator